MALRPYDATDYRTIAHWMALRDRAPMPEWSVPVSGLMVDDIAVGFLILTNNYCGILDFYISNPMASDRERNEALDLITKELVEFGKKMDCKLILATTQVTSIASRALKHGFKKDGEYMYFVKEL